MAIETEQRRTVSTNPVGSEQRACPTSENFRRAAIAWAQALGDGYVEDSSAVLDRYARTTGTQSYRPLAVLRPGNTAQVRQIVNIAGEFAIPVHAISKGKNWGYGDAAPPGDQQVLIDLGRMNRVLELNCQLGYVVIEPGVTQGELYEYLRINAPEWQMDVTGAGLDSSVIGNTLDRGFGHTRYGDHALTTCGMEVVLADGQVFQTGLGHYQTALANRAYRHGVGPMLEGLFTQSNFGIVTQMGIYLMPRPQAFCAFFIPAESEEDLAPLVDGLAALRMQGILQTTIHLANDLRAISGRMRYPFERANQLTPLPLALRQKLRKECAVGAWNVCGSITGTPHTVAAARKALRAALKQYKIIFVDDRRLALAERICRWLNRIGFARQMAGRLEILKPVYGLLNGIPTNETLRGALWRVRNPAPSAPTDPLDCHAGLMWISPTLPAIGSAAQDLMELIDQVYHKHQFETLVTFTLVTDRALVCVTNIAFDRRYPEEVDRAQRCYQELTDLLMRSGYILYRCGPQSTKKLAMGSSGFWEAAARIKRALDPQRILSPGRYDPLW